MATASLFGNAHQRIVTYYDQSDKWSFIETKTIRAYFTLASLAAKYDHYTFDEADIDDYLMFFAYNDDCSFFLKYDKTTNECTVEFNTCDLTFSYCSFKKVLDSFFLYN